MDNFVWEDKEGGLYCKPQSYPHISLRISVEDNDREVTLKMFHPETGWHTIKYLYKWWNDGRIHFDYHFSSIEEAKNRLKILAEYLYSI